MKLSIFLSNLFYNIYTKHPLPEGYYPDKSMHGEPCVYKKKGVFATTGEQFYCFKL